MPAGQPCRDDTSGMRSINLRDIFRPEAQSRPLNKVTARDFSQTTHRARRAQPRSFQDSSEDHGVTLEWRS